MKLPFKVNLENKVVVITGGGGILCSKFAEALAELGAKVAILDINEKSIEKILNKIKIKNGIAIGIPTNVLDIESLRNAEREISDQFGACNILINGAGGNHPKGTTSQEFLSKEALGNNSFFDLGVDGIKFIFDLNFIGTLLTTQIFAKKMIEAEDPVIINISSMNSFRPLTKIPAYSAAKAAVSNFTQWLSVHLSKVGIRVNAIAPGFFLTEQNKNLLQKEDGSLTPRAEKILDHTPMGRFGQPEDLIGTLLWLIDDRASGFVNGIIVPVDGGFSAYSGV